MRDFRFTFSGRFKTKRSITYTMGLMYDGPTTSWFPRETGIQVGIPELWGNVFVGRQKEGFSLSKISVGYSIPMMERTPVNDAMIPIMTDGVKWLGVHPSGHANWNIGFFKNVLPKNPSTDWFDKTAVARFSWVPMHPEKDQSGTLLHLGAAYRWAKIANSELRLKSRPESFTAPNYLDTGKFKAEHNDMIGLESYYRPGSWLYGAEYFINKVDSSGTGNPLFHGGEVLVAWLITGEVRPYHDIGGKLGFVFPKRPVSKGGPGAWEVFLRYTYTDFNTSSFDAGKFWRITPHVNWYLTDVVRLEFNYGIGTLDRFGTTGLTQFFQTRLQLQIQ